MVCENQRLLAMVLCTFEEDISGCFVLDQVAPSHFWLSLPVRLAFRISRSPIILAAALSMSPALRLRPRKPSLPGSHINHGLAVGPHCKLRV